MDIQALGSHAKYHIDNYKADLQKIVDQLLFGDYKDPIGHILEHNLAFIALKELALEQATVKRVPERVAKRPVEVTITSYIAPQKVDIIYTGEFHGFFQEGNEDGHDTFVLIELEDGTIKKSYQTDTLKFLDRG